MSGRDAPPPIARAALLAPALAPALIAILMVSAARQAGAQLPGWSLEYVDADVGAGRNPSMIVDALGRMAIAYDKAGVWFARLENGSWVKRAIPPGALSEAATSADYGAVAGTARTGFSRPFEASLIHIEVPSLACDSQGRARVAWTHWDGTTTYYSTEESSWTPQLAASGGVPSLIVDALDQPHLTTAFFNATFLYSDASATWAGSPILPQASGVGAALAPNGILGFAYRRSDTGDLCLATLDQGTWSDEVADTVGAMGFNLKLVFDAQNVPHIAYYDVVSHQVRHAFRSGGGWVVEKIATVFNPSNVEALPSLAVDPQGNPAVSYMDYGWGRLLYASRPGGVWVVNPVMDSYPTIRSSLVFDTDGNPRIAIGGDAGNGLWLATRTTPVAVEGNPLAQRSFTVRVAPNPQRIGATLHLELSLPTATAVRIEAFDLAGRRVDARSFGELPAGAARLEWTPAFTSPGVYIVRASAGARESSTFRVLAVR